MYLVDRNTRSSIGKKVAEVVIRNNYNADINFVLLKAVPEMHDITLSISRFSRHLNLYADPGNDCFIVPHAFGPIYRTGSPFVSNPFAP